MKLCIMLIFILVVGIIVEWNAMKDFKYSGYKTISANGETTNYIRGTIIHYRNRFEIWHGKRTFKVKKMIRERGKITKIICEDANCTREYSIIH